MSGLEEYRSEINVLDAQIAELFEKRMNVSKKIAGYKKERGLPIKNLEREAQITANSSNLIKEPEIEQYYISFQRKVIDLSCDYQAKLMEGMKVAYSGVEGAYAYIASSRLFPGAQLISYSNFEPAYRAVERGEADCAVLPIENSYAGDVGAVMDLAFSGSLFINKVSDLEILHNLLSVEGATTDSIKKVISHPQALAQCDEFIKAHGYEAVETTNTAVAAKTVKKMNDPTVAAIASADTADIFGLKILESGINTSKNNTSRFAVFSKVQNRPGNDVRNELDNFIIVFTCRNEPGSLSKPIDIIGSHGFNMRNLKSRPMKDLIWEYYFYIEAEGNISTQNGQDMLRELSVVCKNLKLLGAYNTSILEK